MKVASPINIHPHHENLKNYDEVAGIGCFKKATDASYFFHVSEFYTYADLTPMVRQIGSLVKARSQNSKMYN
jgi:hypothetical protein